MAAALIQMETKKARSEGKTVVMEKKGWSSEVDNHMVSWSQAPVPIGAKGKFWFTVVI
jgi:hypothetical protein